MLLNFVCCRLFLYLLPTLLQQHVFIYTIKKDIKKFYVQKFKFFPTFLFSLSLPSVFFKKYIMAISYVMNPHPCARQLYVCYPSYFLFNVRCVPYL